MNTSTITSAIRSQASTMEANVHAAFTGDTEAIARVAVGIVTQLFVGCIAFSIAYAVFSFALWSWIACILAAIAALVSGAVSGNFAGGPGFDLAKQGCAWVTARFNTAKA